MPSTLAAPLLVWSLIGLVSAHLATHALFLFGGYDHQLGFRRAFDLGKEWNVPSLYSGGLILANAVALFGVGIRLLREARRGWLSWCFLAAVFTYLSIDETFSLHEHLTTLTRDALNITDGAFYFAWVLPGMAFALVVFLLSINFLRGLDRGSFFRVMLAGGIYVGGAVGVEILGGWRWQAVGGNSVDPLYILLFTCEETLEIAGMSLMFYAVLRRSELMFGNPASSLPRANGHAANVAR